MSRSLLSIGLILGSLAAFSSASMAREHPQPAHGQVLLAEWSGEDQDQDRPFGPFGYMEAWDKAYQWVHAGYYVTGVTSAIEGMDSTQVWYVTIRFKK